MIPCPLCYTTRNGVRACCYTRHELVALITRRDALYARTLTIAQAFPSKTHYIKTKRTTCSNAHQGSSWSTTPLPGFFLVYHTTTRVLLGLPHYQGTSWSTTPLPGYFLVYHYHYQGTSWSVPRPCNCPSRGRCSLGGRKKQKEGERSRRREKEEGGRNKKEEEEEKAAEVKAAEVENSRTKTNQIKTKHKTKTKTTETYFSSFFFNAP